MEARVGAVVAALPKARVPVEAGLVEAVPVAVEVAGVAEPHNNTRVVGVAHKLLVGIRDNRPVLRLLKHSAPERPGLMKDYRRVLE